MDSPDPENTRDLELLRNHPQDLIINYQPIIGIIVRRYISTGMFEHGELHDVIQTVNEHLLVKLPIIQKQYNGTTFVRTYVSAIIRNVCLKMHEKETRALKPVPLGDPPDKPILTDSFAIEHARQLIKAILQQYNHRNQLPKLLLFLKLRFRVPLLESDILSWYPSCPKAKITLLLEKFGDEYEQMHENEIYHEVTPVANRAEGKSNTEEAMRKWTQSRITEIIELLNGTPEKWHFDEDSLKVLMEDFFSPFLQKEG